MISRCHVEEHSDYFRYGAKGTKVCDAWREEKTGLNTFIEDIGPRPSKEYLLGRKDNSKDYCPENCEWITQAEANLRRDWKHGKNKYVGVYKHNKKTGPPIYEARVAYGGKGNGSGKQEFYCGQHTTAEKAAKARLDFKLKNDIPLGVRDREFEEHIDIEPTKADKKLLRKILIME